MSDLKQHHPLLMVPEVFTFGVVIYTTDGVKPATFPSQDAIRQALIAALPPGTGVGTISITNHGVYVGAHGARS